VTYAEPLIASVTPGNRAVGNAMAERGKNSTVSENYSTRRTST
jgi:hypothetical protein